MAAPPVAVQLYTLSTCPWCRKAKAWMSDHDVDFSFTDYDLAEEDEQGRIRDDMEAHGARVFPYAMIGDQIVVGFRPDRYGELLGVEAEEEPAG